MCIPSLIPNRLIRFTAEMWTHGSWPWPTRSARTFSSRRSRSASPRRGGTRFLQSTQTSTGLASGEHRNQRRGRSVIRGGESTDLVVKSQLLGVMIILNSSRAASPDQLHGSTCSLCILLQECILHHYISPHATRETVSPTPRTTAMTSTCRVPL